MRVPKTLISPRKDGSSPLTGDAHSLNTIDYPVPTALCKDAHAVILEISKPKRSPEEHPHLGVESGVAADVGRAATWLQSDGLQGRF